MGQGAISKEDLTPDLCDSVQNIAVYNKQIPTERESGMDLEFHLAELLGIDKNMKLRSLIPGLCRLIC